MLKLFLFLFRRAFGALWADSRGNIVISFVCAMPILMATTGIAIDFGTMTMKRATLQAAADEAAVAGAKQLTLASTTDIAVKSTVSSFLQNQLTGNDVGATNTTTIDRAKGAVKVEVSESWSPYFAQFIGTDITPIVARATAVVQGESRLCILTLNPTENHAFRMMNSAQVQAASCGVFSNSVDPKGMFLQNFSIISAAIICSAGGVSAAKSQTSVTPQSDCTPVPDPLTAQAIPTVGPCSATNTSISSGTTTLSPGVYCGGLTISGTANVTFKPGLYVVKDAPFTISGSSVADGVDVGFYLAGASAQVNFTGSAKINLSGSETGVMAGLLLFADPAQADGSTHVINATNVQTLTGTIYFPTGDLRVDPASATVASNSAYTAIIVNRIRIEKGPTLVMNTSYGATKVPVPAGVRTSATVVLSN